MWPDTRLCAALGIEVPILLAPMAGSVTPDLAAAVSHAGGLGGLGLGIGTPEAIAEAARAMRARSNAGYNLNLFVLPDLPPQTQAERAAMRALLQPWYDRAGLGEVPDPPLVAPPAGLDEALVRALEEVRPRVVSFHFGLPGPDVMARLKAAGIRVICSATTVEEARAVEAAGCDAVIAQGWEAGGHRGAHRPNGLGDGVGTMALVPQVVDAVTIPVIAAGGIGDGRGIAAAFALGAAGVQMGTAFLSCPECGTDENRRMLLTTAEDTDTQVTDAFSGRAARARRSTYAEEMRPHAGRFAAYGQMYGFTEPLMARFDALDPAALSFHLYGQAAALNRAIPAGELVATLAAEAQAVLQRMGRV